MINIINIIISRGLVGCKRLKALKWITFGISSRAPVNLTFLIFFNILLLMFLSVCK